MNGSATCMATMPCLNCRPAWAGCRCAKRILAPLSSDGAVVGIIELAAPGSVNSVIWIASCWSAVPRPSAWRCAHRCCVRNWCCWKSRSARASCRPSRKAARGQRGAGRAEPQPAAVANHLEEQQAELEQSNVQLEERTHELEAQKQALLVAQSQLVRNNELATSRYKSEFWQHVARTAHAAEQLADPGQAWPTTRTARSPRNR